MSDDVGERIQKLLVTGDNRLKQGVSPEKVREMYEQALTLARENGLEERIRPLVEVRLAGGRLNAGAGTVAELGDGARIGIYHATAPTSTARFRRERAQEHASKCPGGGPTHRKRVSVQPCLEGWRGAGRFCKLAA